MRKLILAAICFCLAMTPALANADGYGYRHHGYGKHYGGYDKHRGGYHKHRGGHHKYRGHRRHHKHDDDDDIEAGEVIAGVFLGGLLLYALTRNYDRQSYRASPRGYEQPSYYDCRWTTGQAYEGRRVAEYEGLLCRSSQGPGWYAKPGSVRFLGYVR
ncbi:MAG: hypothetical protein R3316_12445 [Rhodovibrionaceae bacterium]|nr:hypothetical protein [Rhodovibrionaceae bacterium]